MTRRGISRAVKVHEFAGKLFNKPAFIRVTSVAGHIFTRDFPPLYQNWEGIDPFSLFDAETIAKEVI